MVQPNDAHKKEISYIIFNPNNNTSLISNLKKDLSIEGYNLHIQDKIELPKT